jgi:hypothetical protein
MDSQDIGLVRACDGVGSDGAKNLYRIRSSVAFRQWPLLVRCPLTRSIAISSTTVTITIERIASTTSFQDCHLRRGDAMGEMRTARSDETDWLQADLGELECPDFSKSILPALVFRSGFTTLHCACSPIQDVRVVERSDLVSFIHKFGFTHLLSLLSLHDSFIPKHAGLSCRHGNSRLRHLFGDFGECVFV